MLLCEFTVPVRTVSESNVREHHMARYRRADDQRQAVTAALMDSGARVTVTAKKRRSKPGKPPALVARLDGVPPAVPLHVSLTRVAPRELDGHDNLRVALKAVADQVTDLLGFSNDRDERLSWSYGQEKGRAREYAVRVRVESSVMQGGRLGPT